MKQNIIVLFCLAIAYLGCKDQSKASSPVIKNRGVISENAMVVSAREEASKIGVEILKQGGNAFDAMMATEMALAVCYPYAGNLGGGRFLIFGMADGSIGALDYREKAPLASSKDMYLDENGDVIKDLSTVGSMAVGIPGTIAGVFKAQKRFGKLDIETVLKPVIELAKQGYTITKKQEERITSYDSMFKAVNEKEILYNKNLKAGQSICLLYTSPSPRDLSTSRMPSSA